MGAHEKYGLLLVGGAQTHQENYARAFEADPRCHLIGLTDEADVPLRRRALNLQLADDLKIPYLDSFDEAISRDDVHVASICTEPERRGRVAVRCAAAGKHVYIDKPLTADVGAARQVVAAVREAGVLSQMFSLVRSSLAARAKRIIDSGRLGTLTGLHCELLFAKGPAGGADLSLPRQERDSAERFTFLDSKRELFCVGLYPLVLFPWLTKRRLISVYGTTSNYFFEAHQRNDVEDFSCLLLQMEGDIEATITVGRTGWSSHPHFGVHQLHLIGTNGVETIDAYRPRLEVYSDASPWQQPTLPHPEDPMGFWSSTQREGGILPKTDWWPIEAPYQNDASYFLDCLEVGRESDVPAALGAQAVEAIFAGYQSAASGEVVPLAE